MTVVVGVGASDGSLAAIRLAAAEAGYRNVPLIAVMAYSGEHAFGAPAGRPVATLRTGDDDRAEAESVLSDAVHDALGEQANRVDLRPVPGPAGRKLVETADQAAAELIVLAARRGTAMVPGTVTQYVLRNAACPVLIVPESGKAKPSA